MRAANLDWRDRAACKNEDPALFFAPDGEEPAAAEVREAQAKAVCASCPVAADCFWFAGAVGIRTGIWGGIDLGQRMCGNRRHVMTAANTQRRSDGTTCCRACRQATDQRYRQKQQQEEEVAA
jgi:WhiB family redox-sensing transcriptional regulator